MNERSAMKVNTDGVLLGAVMTLLPQDRRLLDVGTGTGTIALMAAQRLAEGFPVESGMTGKMPGMTEHEIITLTKYMLESGDRLDLSALEQ